MARTSAKVMAVPRRLPLGRQRQCLYLSRPRAKEGGWADARVSNELATTRETAATCRNVRDSTVRFCVAILGKRPAATRTGPVALNISPQPSAYISGNLDRSRRRSNNLPERLQRVFRSTTVSTVDVSKANQETSAAWQSPRRKLRNSKRWLAMRERPWVVEKTASMLDGNGAKSLPPKQS